MPASRTVILEQIKRFKDHPNYPEDPRELAKAFAEAALTDEHVRQIADYLMSSARSPAYGTKSDTPFCPVPGDVYAAAEILAQQHKYDGRSPSPFHEPGQFGLNLGDGMTSDEAARWEHMAQSKNKHQRAVAEAMLAQYRKPVAAAGAQTQKAGHA